MGSLFVAFILLLTEFKQGEILQKLQRVALLLLVIIMTFILENLLRTQLGIFHPRFYIVLKSFLGWRGPRETLGLYAVV